MKQCKIITHEREGAIQQFDGRTVWWLMTPEKSRSQYSSVCTVIYDVNRRAKPAHSHPDGEETVYVISGKGKVKVGDDVTADIEPGSLIYFPQGVPHMIWNCGGEPMHCVCFYAPAQQSIGTKIHEDFDFPDFK
jgi:mannose-6-phosphate isomerase-like protein (cupin superfamily)